MDWKFVGKLWFSTLLIFTLGCILIGCGNNRWSPTDPVTDTSKLSIEATWEMDVNAEITP